jgi:hypothetical protein
MPSPRDLVHFVGSVPLHDSDTVFRTLATRVCLLPSQRARAEAAYYRHSGPAPATTTRARYTVPDDPIIPRRT